MLKTTILAGLLASAAAPGGTIFTDEKAAIRHAVEQIKAAKAQPEQVCYNDKKQERATAVLMYARLADGRAMAYEVLRTPDGYRVGQVTAPDKWPHKVACEGV